MGFTTCISLSGGRAVHRYWRNSWNHHWLDHFHCRRFWRWGRAWNQATISPHRRLNCGGDSPSGNNSWIFYCLGMHIYMYMMYLHCYIFSRQVYIYMYRHLLYVKFTCMFFFNIAHPMSSWLRVLHACMYIYLFSGFGLFWIGGLESWGS